MPSGMRPALLAILLLTSTVLQVSATSWFSSLFANPLSDIQRLVQQRQQQQWQQQRATLASMVPDSTFAVERRQLQETAVGSYGGYSYGDYGYGYGYGYGESQAAAGSGSGASGSRHLLAEAAAGQSNLAPTLIYNEPAVEQHLSAVLAAGEAHSDGIELPLDEAAAAVPSGWLDQPSEKKAARKLLLTASNIKPAVLEHHVLPVAPLMLEPADELLAGSSGRSLLQIEDAGSYGGYGYGGYSYGDYGYGYGYGAPAGRMMLEVAESDDVQLYKLWMEQHNLH